MDLLMRTQFVTNGYTFDEYSHKRQQRGVAGAGTDDMSNPAMAVGDLVTWKGSDDELPFGTVGKVVKLYPADCDAECIFQTAAGSKIFTFMLTRLERVEPSEDDVSQPGVDEEKIKGKYAETLKLNGRCELNKVREWPREVTIEGKLLKCCRRRAYFSKKSRLPTQSTRYFVLSESEQRLCWSKKVDPARPTKSLDLRRARLTLMQGGDDGDIITIQPSPLTKSPPLSFSAPDEETLLNWYSLIIAAIEGPIAHAPVEEAVSEEQHSEKLAEHSAALDELRTAEEAPPPLPSLSKFAEHEDAEGSSDEEPAVGFGSSSSIFACFGVSEPQWTLPTVPLPLLNPLQRGPEDWTDSPGGVRTRFRVAGT
jgi:hypothetical protein